MSRFPAGPGWSNEILLQLFRDGQELVNLLLRDASGQRRLCGGDPPLCLLIQRVIRFIRASLTPIERWTRPSSSSRFSSREAVELRMQRARSRSF